MDVVGAQEQEQAVSLETLLRAALAKRRNYAELQMGALTAMLRLSRVRRRTKHATPNSDVLDVDIVQIKVRKNARRKGVATGFVKSMLHAARSLGRCVYLENCITTASAALAAKLVAAKLFLPHGPCPDSFLSVIADHQAKQGTEA